MAPRVYWLRPDDHLCSMSLAKAKKLSAPMKSKGKASSGNSSKRLLSEFAGYSLAKKRKTFRDMKQGCSESVTKWHDRIKEIAPLCKLGDDLEDKMKDKFIKGLKAGPIHVGVMNFSGSMGKLLELAKSLENTFNKEAFGSDVESTNDEDNDAEDDVDFEKDKANYREVHAYDCPCLYCDIIRYNKTKKDYNPNNSHPAKLILVPKSL